MMKISFRKYNFFHQFKQSIFHKKSILSRPLKQSELFHLHTEKNYIRIFETFHQEIWKTFEKTIFLLLTSW